MPRLLALPLVGLLMLGSAGAAPGRDSYQADAARQFIGTWRLVSFTNRLADGTTRQDPRSVGYIMYSDVGRMCATIMDANRPKWASAGTPTATEAISALAGFISYCGTYEVNGREGFVVHHVDIERTPNLVGIDRKRSFTFDGKKRLALHLEPSEVPGVIASTLVWERVEAAAIR